MHGIGEQERARLTRRTLIDIAQRRQRPGSGSSTTFLRSRSAILRWPNLSDVLDPLPWAVVGAVATRAYMPERATQDLDVAVLAEHALEVQRRLREAGYRFDARLSIGGSRWFSPEGTTVDIIKGHEPWWQRALGEANLNRDPQGLPVLPLPYLVLMKLHAGRLQDVADVSRMLGQASDKALDAVLDVTYRYRPDLREDVESLIQLGKLEMQEP
jgi:hypothetical protein